MTDTESNLDKLRRWEATYRREGDMAALGLVDEVFHPEIEFSPRFTREIEGRTLHGREELRAFFEDLRETFDNFGYEPAEFESISDDVIIVRTRLVGAGRGSDVQLAQELASVYEFEDGLVRRLTAFGSREEALSRAMTVQDA